MSAFMFLPGTQNATSLSLTFQLSCLWGPLWSRRPPPGEGRLQVLEASLGHDPGRACRREKRFSQKPSARRPGVWDLSEVLISKHLMKINGSERSVSSTM